jgi:hypothetical protein
MSEESALCVLSGTVAKNSVGGIFEAAVEIESAEREWFLDRHLGAVYDVSHNLTS